jgi:hypothetical protein
MLTLWVTINDFINQLTNGLACWEENYKKKLDAHVCKGCNWPDAENYTTKKKQQHAAVVLFLRRNSINAF